MFLQTHLQEENNINHMKNDVSYFNNLTKNYQPKEPN